MAHTKGKVGDLDDRSLTREGKPFYKWHGFITEQRGVNECLVIC